MSEQPLIPPWQDPEQEDFWRARPETQRISVRLSQHATEAIWHVYNISREGYLPLSYEGEVLEQPLTYDQALEYCRSYRAFVYNVARRKAWRLAWKVPKIEQRERHNSVFEPVEVMGYKGLSDQWIDRPRVKLFANDF